MLSKAQVHHITRVVQAQHFKSFLLENEVIDFVSCAVEDRLAEGEDFEQALYQVMNEMDVERISRLHKPTTIVRKLNAIDMFQNYLKIAFRNFLKYKVNTAINVFGLVLGLSTSIIIGLYLKHEFSFDNMHPNLDRLYRVNSISYMGQSPSHLDAVSPMLRDVVLNEIPEIELASDLDNPYFNKPLKWDQKTFFDYRFGAVQEDFFSMFHLPVLEGRVEALYANPHGVFLSKSLVTRIFGETDPIGKVVVVVANDGEKELEVRGVYEDMPANSVFTRNKWSQFDMLTSVETSRLLTGNRPGWGSIQNSMYIRLTEGADEQVVNDKLNALLKAQMEKEPWYEHYIQPVRDLHLNQRGYEIESTGDIDQLYLFSAIAVLILLIACINYINLTTAQASVRLKEVGIRKVIGARRRQFILQFLVEATLVTFLSMVVATVFVYLMIPSLNSTFSLELSLSLSQDAMALFGFLGVMAAVSLLCGTYPGFYLSRLQPNELLKTGQAVKSGGGLFRKVLVVLQYTTSITLIIATLVITNQLQYMSQRDLGFDKEQVVYLKIGYQQSQKYGETLFNEISRNPGVLHASLTGNTLGEGSMSGNGIRIGDMAKEDREMHQVLPVDFDYHKTLGLEMTAGRWFSEEFASDRAESFVVNQAFVDHFGIKEPIGQRISRNSQKGVIVGVVKDFHYMSMRQSIDPLVIFMAPRDKFGYWNMAVRLAPGTTSETLESLEETWESIVPDYPLNYQFLDEEIDQYYKADRDFANMFRIFSLLAIIVSCLGLVGLVSFSTKRRSKEIGVRKVLGATVLLILRLISRDLVKLIFIGALVAVPIAYFFMQQWLENFEYRTGISWWVFVVALIVTVLISWLSVSYISFKAARANPVDSLRTE